MIWVLRSIRFDNGPHHLGLVVFNHLDFRSEVVGGSV